MPLFTRMLKYPFQGQVGSAWRWPKSVPADGWDKVSIPHPAGATLSGVFGVAEGDPKGTLLLAHPLGRRAKGFWLSYGHAAYFRERGFHVLAMDFNGFGESPDATFDFPLDVLAAHDWLRGNHPGLACGAVGSSFGGAWILCAMARRKLFDAALIESTFPKLMDYWRSYPLPHATLRLSSLVMPKLERSMRPEHAAGHIKDRQPVVLLYSRTDTHTPLAHGETLRAALSQSTDVELLIAKDAKHTHIFRDDRAMYDQAVDTLAAKMVQARRASAPQPAPSQVEMPR